MAMGWPFISEVPEMTLVEANRLVAFGLVVLIWTVQLVIYPALAAIAPERFIGWHADYTRAITRVVAPLMLAQVGLLGWLLVTRPSWWTALAVGLVAVAWAVTFLLAVPAHERLQGGGIDQPLIRRLIATNWVRTVAWTLAFLCLLVGPYEDRGEGGDLPIGVPPARDATPDETPP